MYSLLGLYVLLNPNLSTALLYSSAEANFNYFQLLVQTIAQQLSQLIVRSDSMMRNAL